jgi:hypothetical protein
MQNKYYKDRSFTDYVHTNLAIPLIYDSINWNIKNIDANKLKELDMNEGIDYVLLNEMGQNIYVQERFRDEYYKNYDDATLRYRRDSNIHTDRKKSEYYKINANYLVYGITNGKKFDDQRHTLTKFIKWVILDLDFLREKFKSKKIEIIKTSAIKCQIDNGILKCPENFNPDGSSSFIPFDIKMIVKLWGLKPIKAQYGFL